MFFFVLVNTVEMLWGMTEPEDRIANVLNRIDEIMLYIFTAEIAFRVLGTGLYIYFSDSWNKFDFILVVFSYIMDAALNSMDFANNARSVRLVKISRLQKTLRITRSFRGLRIFKFCMGILSSFYRIKQLLEIIIISLPALWRTLSLILIFFYLWGCVGCELFRESNLARLDIPPYGLLDFYTYGDGIMELAHMMIANGWGELMLNYCDRFNTSGVGLAYFLSFHAIVTIVLLGLLSGLVWEVFSFVDKTSNVEGQKQNEAKTELDDLSKNLRRNHFHTLRYVSVIRLEDSEDEDNKDRPAESAEKGSINMTGLQKEIKKEMGDESKVKVNPFIPQMARKSIHFSTNREILEKINYKKRASLTNAITGSLSPLNMIKDKLASDPRLRHLLGLNRDLDKVDGSLKVPKINEIPSFVNPLANLNLDYGVGLEKMSFDSSSPLVSHPLNDPQLSKAESESQRDLFVDSNREIVTFSDDVSAKEIVPALSSPLGLLKALNKRPEIVVKKPNGPDNPGLSGNQSLKYPDRANPALDKKSLVPQKPNSESEESHSKEGFGFNHLKVNVGKQSKDFSVNSSEINNELVLKKRVTSNVSKTELPNKKGTTKVGLSQKDLDGESIVGQYQLRSGRVGLISKCLSP